MRTQLVLTQRGVEAAKPKAKRYGKPDGTVPGLRLVIFPSGEKTYALFTRINGRLINHKIGSATVLGLASARKEARRKLEEISGGQDPRETRREAKRAEFGNRRGCDRTIHRTLRQAQKQKLGGDPAEVRC